MRQGWVIELGPGESGSKGGKKPTLIRFNADAGRLFGAEIDAAHVRLAVADLEGNIRERLTNPIGPDRSAASVLSIVRRGLARLIDSQPSVGVQRVISIAAPGRVDVRLGVVLDAGNLFNWRGVPVREQIEAEFGLPVFVDNDVKMATLGEIQFGRGQGRTGRRSGAPRHRHRLGHSELWEAPAGTALGSRRDRSHGFGSVESQRRLERSRLP